VPPCNALAKRSISLSSCASLTLVPYEKPITMPSIQPWPTLNRGFIIDCVSY
jgi:hypothetical protein